MRLKKGDNVMVIAGKEKSKSGKIVRVLVSSNKVIVEGLNIVKNHQRPRKTNEKGSMIDISMPIHASNVMLIDPKTNKQILACTKKAGNKMGRISKKSKQEIR